MNRPDPSYEWKEVAGSFMYALKGTLNTPNRIVIRNVGSSFSIKFWASYQDHAWDGWKIIDTPPELANAPIEEVKRYAEMLWRLDTDPQLIKP